MQRDSGGVERRTPDPAGRLVLFDGASLDDWQHPDGRPATWPVSAGTAEVGRGDLRTRQSFGDFRLHVEFQVPELPPEVTGQSRGNSGVYLQGRYEVQVLDSHGDALAPDGAGAIYRKRAPDVNMATPPGTWQAYDVTFRAARFDGAGTKSANARVTVVWNGRTVHDDVEIDGPTEGGAAEGPTPGPIRLQDHGDPGPRVRYRNIWLEPHADVA